MTIETKINTKSSTYEDGNHPCTGHLIINFTLTGGSMQEISKEIERHKTRCLNVGGTPRDAPPKHSPWSEGELHAIKCSVTPSAAVESYRETFGQTARTPGAIKVMYRKLRDRHELDVNPIIGERPNMSLREEPEEPEPVEITIPAEIVSVSDVPDAMPEDATSVFGEMRPPLHECDHVIIHYTDENAPGRIHQGKKGEIVRKNANECLVSIGSHTCWIHGDNLILDPEYPRITTPKPKPYE